MKKHNGEAHKIWNSWIRSDDVIWPERILGYFLGPFLGIVSGCIFGSYLNRYYSDVLNWTDVKTFGPFSSILPIVSVILTVCANLMIGRLIDNLRTRQGKARPLLLLSAPLMIVAIFGLMRTPLDGEPWIQILWISISYLFYYSVVNPLYNTSHSSLVPLSTRNTEQRGLLATLSNAANVTAVGVGASILVPIFLQKYLFVEKNGVLDRVQSYENWKKISIIMCLVTFVGILIEYFFTRERVTEENMKQETSEKKITLSQQIKGCMSDKSWWAVILFIVLFQLGGGIKNGSMSYYCRWLFDGVASEEAAGTRMGMLGLLGGIPTVIGMFLAWPIAKKFGNRRSVTVGLILAILGGLFSFIDVHNFTIVCIGIILKGIGTIPAMYLMLVLLSEVLDNLEVRNGYRSDGFTMSIYSAIMVCMSGVANSIINGLLTLSGYQAQLAKQNPEVSGILVLCYLGIELICYVLIVIIFMCTAGRKKKK